MEAKLTACWLFLTNLYAVFGGAFDLQVIKESLNSFEKGLAAETVLHGWKDRSLNFFQGVEKRTWQEVIPQLSDSQMREIRPKEFELCEFACQAFAEHLPKLSNPEALPSTFRKAVYQLLKEDNKRNSEKLYVPGDGSCRTSQVIKAIPPEWMSTHSKLFMQVLTESQPPRLSQLRIETLAALLGNPNDACQLITLNVLLSLNHMQLVWLSPNCISNIIGLGAMDLSEIVGYLRNDAFAEYNGPLSKTTIRKLSGAQIEKFGHSLTNDAEICTVLELHHLSPAAVVRATGRCLCGYFGSSQREIGLGELWKHITTWQVYPAMFLEEACLANIPAKEYDSMGSEALHGILSLSRFCPTTDIAFWTEERMGHISPDCLYRILGEAEPPVKLGKLWQSITHLDLGISFTPEMGSVWLNIDHGEFYLMPARILRSISLQPGVCSALGVWFWMGERMESISGQCLYEILTKDSMPPRLGSLWVCISARAIYDFTKKSEIFWTFIHPEDHYAARVALGLAIGKNPNICGHLDFSFWTRETIEYLSEYCLVQIIQSSPTPVALGELWEHLPPRALKAVMGWLSSYLRCFAESDFEHMPSELLNWIFSSGRVKYYLPAPRTTRIILSPKASEVESSPEKFAAIVRLDPNIAWQLLWYSKKLPENVLSSCNDSDISNLVASVISNGKKVLAKTEDGENFEERVELFIRKVLAEASGNANGHSHTLAMSAQEIPLPAKRNNPNSFRYSKLQSKTTFKPRIHSSVSKYSRAPVNSNKSSGSDEVKIGFTLVSSPDLAIPSTKQGDQHKGIRTLSSDDDMDTDQQVDRNPRE